MCLIRPKIVGRLLEEQIELNHQGLKCLISASILDQARCQRLREEELEHA